MFDFLGLTKNESAVNSTKLLRKAILKSHLNTFHALDSLNYLIANSEICIKQKPQLLIWIYSAPGNFARRKAVRETWGNSTLYLPKNIAIVFSLAVTSNRDIQLNIAAEQKVFGDLIQDGSFIDAYRNLTYKVGQF